MTTDLLLKDLLELFNDEDLIRFVRRAEKRAMLPVAQLLRAEQKTRDDQAKLLQAPLP